MTNQIIQKIQKQINEGKITKKPKMFFVLNAILLSVGTVLLALTSIYLLSFIAFIERERSPITLLGVGKEGVYLFMSNFPWIFTTIALILIVVTSLLVRRFEFGYRTPIIILLGSLFIIVLTVFFTLEKFSVSPQIIDKTLNGPLKGIGDSYRQKDSKLRSGIITDILSTSPVTSFVLDSDKGVVVVTIDEYTKISPDVLIEIGNRVVVLGELDEISVKAKGIVSPRSMPKPNNLPPGNGIYR